MEGQAYRLNFKTGAEEKLDIPPHPRVLLRDVLHQLNNCLAGLAADPPTEGGTETNIAFDGLGTYTRAPGDPPSLYSPIDLTLPAALLGDVDEGDTNSERRCSTCLQWEREALRADGLVAPCPPSRTGQHHWEHWTNLVRRAVRTCNRSLRRL